MTIEKFLSNATPKQREMYLELEKGVRNFSDFPIDPKGTQISFKGGSHNKNICVVKFMAQHLQIQFNLKKDDFIDSKDLVIRAEHNTRGKQSRVKFTDIKELGYILDLIKQSYEKNKY